MNRLNWPIILTLLFWVAVIIYGCTGCTTVTYPTPAGDVTYTSFLTDRKLDSLKLTLIDGTELELREYTSEQSKIAEAVARGVAEGATKR
jgi:hypothetical protein